MRWVRTNIKRQLTISTTWEHSETKNWELNIRDAINKAIQHWKIDNKDENELLDTLQKYNKIEMTNNVLEVMKNMKQL